MFGAEAMPRRWLDWLGIAATSLVLMVLVSLGLYGSFLGFLQTRTYYDANQWVALGAGVIGAGCALYLLVELTGRVNGRQVLVICILSGMFAVFAVTKGVPAAVTVAVGRPAAVWFTVTGFDWGGKGCPRNVVATNPDYEDFRMCTTHLEGTPKLGGRIELRGTVSDWGIARDEIIVR